MQHAHGRVEIVKEMERRIFRCAVMAMLLSVVVPLPALAEDLPLWDLGIGAGALALPHYRGASSVAVYALPFPFAQYRGKRLQVDEEGVQGLLFRSEWVELDVSFAAGVAAPNDADSARAGMPELDPTVEMGPSLDIKLWRDELRRRAFKLRLPARAAMAFDHRHVEHVGWVFAPFVEYRSFKAGRGVFTLSVGPLFADRRYHDYFYTVSPTFATPGRAEYHADSGYAGSRITLALRRRAGRHWVGVFARVDTLDGAVFRDSPLVEQEFYFAAGVAFARILASSRESAGR